MSRFTTAEDDQETTPLAPIDTHSHDVFRKFFEAQFQPIELPGHQTRGDGHEIEEEFNEEESEGSASGSEWGGLSGDDDGNNTVEVVEHQELSTKRGDELDKKARKAFMVCLHHT